MTLPAAAESVRDGGLNLAQPASMMPIVMGVASAGPLQELTLFSSVSELTGTHGEGPGVELAAAILAKGGPIGFLRMDPSVAASNGDVSNSGSGAGTVALSGDAAFDALLRIRIVAGGVLGVATFQYNLDGYAGDKDSERTWSEVLTVPAGGTFVIPGLGVTVTFDDDSGSDPFVAGDIYSAEVDCAGWNATDLADAFTVLKAQPTRWRFVVPATSRGCGDETAHALLATALQSQLAALASTSKYRRGMLATDAGEAHGDVVTAYQDVTAIRCLLAHGQVRRSTVKPLPGLGFPITGAVDVIAARAAVSLPSTDLKRVRSGPLDEVVKLFHDDYRTPTQLDATKISTLRTYENRDGVYITQGRLKSPAGSDFKLWPQGIVMDIACETVHQVLTDSIGRGVRFVNRTVNDVVYQGTIDDRDASTIEDEVNQALLAQLLTTPNAEGFLGQVTGVRYRINRLHNVLSTGVVFGSVGILPLVYIDRTETELGFAVELPDAA